MTTLVTVGRFWKDREQLRCHRMNFADFMLAKATLDDKKIAKGVRSRNSLVQKSFNVKVNCEICKISKLIFNVIR